MSDQAAQDRRPRRQLIGLALLFLAPLALAFYLYYGPAWHPVLVSDSLGHACVLWRQSSVDCHETLKASSLIDEINGRIMMPMTMPAEAMLYTLTCSPKILCKSGVMNNNAK